jgi:hypothetical protein
VTDQQPAGPEPRGQHPRHHQYPPGQYPPGQQPPGQQPRGRQRDDRSPSEVADDELIVRLRGIASRADPVPEALFAAASAALGLRELDVRVAELVRDSAVGASATPVRGLGARLLSFETADTVIECEVTARGARRDVIGQLVGAVAAALRAEVAGSSAVDARVDDDGRFSVSDLPAGLFRLRCSLADGTTLMTSWTTV